MPQALSRGTKSKYLVLALGLSLLLATILGEVGLRFYVAARGWTANCYAASLSMFRPHPTLGYDLRPGFRLQSGVFRIHINSLGLRGPELGSDDPGVTRIAVLGGSSAFGYLVSDGQEAARLLEENLLAAGHNVEVINAGVPGYNLYQTVPRYEGLVARLKPDFVIAYLGWNDLTYVVSPQPQAERFRVRPVAGPLERTLGKSVLYSFLAYRVLGRQPVFAPASLSATQPTSAGEHAFRENLASLLQKIRASGAVPVLCVQASAAHPNAQPELLESLAADAGLREPTVRLGQWLHQTLQEVAQAEQIVLVDSYNTVPPTREYLGDYIHLTAQGERALADLWTERMRPLLQQMSVEQ